MLKQILNEFLSNDGVTTAALIGRDGFVIEIAEKDSESDIEALGALSSSLVRFFDQNRLLLEMGSLHQITLEYRDGVVLISPLTAEEFLVIITDTTTRLGHLTYTLGRTSSRVAAII